MGNGPFFIAARAPLSGVCDKSSQLTMCGPCLSLILLEFAFCLDRWFGSLWTKPVSATKLDGSVPRQCCPQPQHPPSGPLTLVLPSSWLRLGVEQELRAVRLLRALWNHSSAGTRAAWSGLPSLCSGGTELLKRHP